MSEPVQVLLMSHSLGAGGGERQLAQTALALDQTRYRPHVACSEGGFWVERLQRAGVPFFFIGSRSLISLGAVSEARRLRHYLREHEIRMVQTFDYSMNVFGIAVAASAGGVIAISNLRCHMSLIPPRYRALNHWAHRISNAVVVNSVALRNHLIDDYRIAPRRIYTCYNGIDTNVFHPDPRSRVAGLADASLVIGTMCVLRPEKNVALLLEAFAILAGSRPGLRLLIVGSGAELAALLARAEQLGIAGCCVFQPSTADVTVYLRSMDIFVLPSLSEGLSNALMEAMACGCCSLAADVGGNPELLSHGQTGFLFSNNDCESLVRQLTAVIDDKELRQTIAAAGAARMNAEFSLPRAAQQMQHIYDTLIT